MSDDVVLKSINAGVCELKINREQALNSLDTSVLEALLGKLKEIHDCCVSGRGYETVRAVVIRGAGAKAFVAGADIRLMQQADSAGLLQFVKLGQGVMRAIETLPLPVIAVVHGFALGGGLELALACDIIISTERAKFGQPEVNLGVIPGFGGTQRLIRRIGVGAAKRLIFSGEIVGAEEAFRLGLTEYLISGEELESKLSEIIKGITSKAPLAIAAAKRAIEVADGAMGDRGSKCEGLSYEAEEFVRLFSTADAREGLGAFLEKRAANFKGS